MTKRKEEREKIFISFSGGKTSAKMAKWIRDNYSETHDLLFLFANTGQEHEETYNFINNCDKEWNLGVVWVEPVVHFEKGKGTTHKVVNYETACRDGSLFDDMCKKFGISNKAFPHCTRELKLRPMHSYLREIGWKKPKTAIGIRHDEMDRINAKFKEMNYWYPMIDLKETKQTVNDWWEDQPFNLNIPERLGNCTWCWKKSFKKHQQIIRREPSFFDVPKMLEEKYSYTERLGSHQYFFRGNMSAIDLIKASTNQLDMFFDFDINQSNGCEESCEVIGTDQSPDNFEPEDIY